MIDAMEVRGFSPSTQASYVSAIYAMAKHYRRDPPSTPPKRLMPTCCTWCASVTSPTAP
jgi:hypothetical protein